MAAVVGKRMRGIVDPRQFAAIKVHVAGRDTLDLAVTRPFQLEGHGLAPVARRVDVGDVFGKVPQACGLCKKSARRDIECF